MMRVHSIRWGGVIVQAALASGLLALAGWGCMMGAQKVPLASSSRVPAATGEVKTKVTKEGNTEVVVNVEHLAPADRVAKGAQTYVVWVEPLGENQRPQNLGALQVDRDSLKGSFSGITPFHRFRLSITAEPHIATQSPSGNQVLTAQVYQYEKRR